MEKTVVVVALLLFLGLLISNKIKPVLLFTGLLIFYYLFGFLETERFLGNFTNPSLMVLTLLLLVSVVLEKVHLISRLAPLVVGGSSYRFALLKLSAFTTFFSAFLNNTAVVAMLMSALKNQKQLAPSRVLIPLSYFAILGGTMTLIGTSTNLIVNSFVVEAGLESLKMFDFLLVGFALAVSGTVVLMLLAPKLLPEVPQELPMQQEYFLEAKVAADSPLHGRTIAENGLRNLENLFLAELQRGEHLISPVTPDTVVEAGDLLIFTGDITHVESLKQFKGLSIHTDRHHTFKENLVEVVLSHDATLLGMTIKEADFRARFDAAVVAVRRGDEKLSGKLGQKILHAGDILVLAVGRDFYQRSNLKKNFYIVSGVETKNQLSVGEGRIALGAFAVVIALAAFGVFGLLKGLLLLLGFFIAMKFTRFSELKRLFPFDLVIIIGSALGIAHTLYSTGVASDIAGLMLGLFAGYGAYGAFVGVFLLTLVMTEFMTNNAAAALAFPIALATAETLGVSPWPFIMAVAYGASASFISPFGYQTNLMVYSVGGYTLKDFARVGVLMSLTYITVALILIPRVFPF